MGRNRRRIARCDSAIVQTGYVPDVEFAHTARKPIAGSKITAIGGPQATALWYKYTAGCSRPARQYELTAACLRHPRIADRVKADYSQVNVPKSLQMKVNRAWYEIRSVF